MPGNHSFTAKVECKQSYPRKVMAWTCTKNKGNTRFWSVEGASTHHLRRCRSGGQSRNLLNRAKVWSYKSLQSERCWQDPHDNVTVFWRQRPLQTFSVFTEVALLLAQSST